MEVGIKSTVSAIKNFLTIGRGCYQLLNFFQGAKGRGEYAWPILRVRAYRLTDYSAPAAVWSKTPPLK